MASQLKVNQIELNSGDKLVLDGASLDFSSSDQYYVMPAGTTTQRPTSGLDTGYIRFNTEKAIIEWYNGSSWENGSSLPDPRTSNLQAYFDFVHGTDEAYTSVSYNGQNSVRRIASINPGTTRYAYTYGSTVLENGYVDFGNSQQTTNWLGIENFMNGYSNYTIEVYYSVNSFSSSISTVMSGGDGNDILMYLSSTGSTFNWSNIESVNYNFASRVNTPTQFCVTASGTSNKLYMNGTLIASPTVSNATAVVSGQLVFGQEKDSDGPGNFTFESSQCLKGKIYCVRIYNAQLSDAEVLNNYSSTIARFV